MTPSSPPSEHVDPHEVVGYFEGTLSPAQRSGVEAHLSVCEDCTSELTAVSRLRRTAPRAALRLGLAAAAAVAAVVLLGPRAGRPSGSGEPPVRGDGAPAAPSVVAPAEDAILREPPAFTWRPLPGATAYRISISQADGDSVWAAVISDTTVRAPTGALLPSPDVYYWYVDVLLPGGRSVAGTPHQFHLGP